MWPMSQRQVTAMTVDDFETALVSADPDVTKWTGTGNGNYTVWSPYRYGHLAGENDTAEQSARIQVDRFTKDDNDAIVAAIHAALRAHCDEIAFEYQVDFEQDTGYLHHIWDCEVV